MDETYQTVIGLEVHVELLVKSKMFCSCSVKFGAEENSQICPVCFGMPGVLPVLNQHAFYLGLKTSLAFNCKVLPECVFVRKSYFYPDLPKNFQISQYQQPLAVDGYQNIRDKKIGIKRVHLEEDTGKLIHDEKNENMSLIDFNRSGVPLMEIVTEPEISSPQEAEEFLIELKKILKYINVSDCNMEEGSLRVDANISVKNRNSQGLGTKTEIKNLNSFKSVRKALFFESERQIKSIKENKRIAQETRLWDEKMQVTESMRSKEEAHDYRYFPEPDLLPVRVSQDMIEKAFMEIGELPSEREKRFFEQYKLSEYDISVITSEKKLADYFEGTVSCYKEAKTVSNWLQTVLLGILKEKDISIDACPVKPKDFAELISMVDSKKITAASGKDVLMEMIEKNKGPSEIVKQRNLLRIENQQDIEIFVKDVIKENPNAVEDYKKGKQQSLGFLVGMVMKKSNGKADPVKTRDLLKKLL